MELEPESESCALCLLLLEEAADAQVIDLGCGSREGPHRFHDACLRGLVETRSVTGSLEFPPDGVDAANYEWLYYRRLPPVCPLCKRRFTVAGHWPELSQVDELPAGGQRDRRRNPDFRGAPQGADAMVMDGDDPVLDGESDSEDEIWEVSTQEELEAILATAIVNDIGGEIFVRAAPGTAFTVSGIPDIVAVHFFDQVHVTVTETGSAVLHDRVTATLTGGEVHAHEHTQVTVSGNARVEAHDDVQVTASGDAHVVAYDDSQVTASGNATVEAFDTTYVTASDTVEVHARDSLRVTASGNAHVTAHDSAQVIAHGSAHITGVGNEVQIWAAESVQVNAELGTAIEAPNEELEQHVAAGTHWQRWDAIWTPVDLGLEPPFSPNPLEENVYDSESEDH